MMNISTVGLWRRPATWLAPVLTGLALLLAPAAEAANPVLTIQGLGGTGHIGAARNIARHRHAPRAQCLRLREPRRVMVEQHQPGPFDRQPQRYLAPKARCCPGDEAGAAGKTCCGGRDRHDRLFTEGESYSHCGGTDNGSGARLQAIA